MAASSTPTLRRTNDTPQLGGGGHSFPEIVVMQGFKINFSSCQ